MNTTPIPQSEIQRASQDPFPPVMSIAQCAALFQVEPSVIDGWIESGVLSNAIAKIGNVVMVWRDRAVAAVFESGQSDAALTPPYAPRFAMNEEVTIYRRGKKGVYQAEMQLPRHRESLHTTDALEARWRASLLYRADGYVVPPIVDKSMQSAMEEFLETKKIENLAPKTLQKYRNQLRTFVNFGKRHGFPRLLQLTARGFDLYRARQSKKTSAKSLYSDSITVKGFIKWCVARDYMPKNPLNVIKLPKPRQVPTYTPMMEEVAGILAASGRVRRAEFATLAMTGIRAGELRMLRPEDVDLQRGWLTVKCRDGWSTKNGQSRKIPLHPRLVEILTEFAASEPTNRPYFFTVKLQRGSRPNQPVYIREMTLDFQARAKALGLPVGHEEQGVVLHSLRHFFETESVNAGVPQIVVDAWMGHTGDKSMARIYYGHRDRESKSFMEKVPFQTLKVPLPA